MLIVIVENMKRHILIPMLKNGGTHQSILYTFGIKATIIIIEILFLKQHYMLHKFN